MIWEELKESMIFMNLEAADYREVMQKVGSAMIYEDYAYPGYVKELITREEHFPTGLDIGGLGVALPHTDARCAKRDGLAVAVLKKPVIFGLMGTDGEHIKAQLVFMLTVQEPGKHLERLQAILNVIKDRKLLVQMLEAENSTEIIQLIKNKEGHS